MHELNVELIIYNCAISSVYHGAEIFVRIRQKILIIRNYKLAILSVCDVNVYVYLLCILYMWKYIVYVRVYYMPTHRLCGARGGVVVKAVLYKPAGCGFDSRWCHWNFSVT